MTDDLSKKRELADSAKALIEDKAFSSAILSLRKRWFEELMNATGTDEKLELIARTKALEAIPAELGVLINDFKMALHRQKQNAA